MSHVNYCMTMNPWCWISKLCWRGCECCVHPPGWCGVRPAGSWWPQLVRSRSHSTSSSCPRLTAVTPHLATALLAPAPGSCTFSSPGAGSGEGEGAPVLPRQCPYSIIVSVSSPRLSLSPPPSLSPRLTWRPYHVTLTTTTTGVELLSVRHHELCHHQSQLCIVEQLDRYFFNVQIFL